MINFFTITFSFTLRRFIFVKLVAVAFVFLVLNNFSSATAGSLVKGQYSTSKKPYWSVGAFDGRLSDACRRGDFLQRRVGSYSIGYIGKKGRGITGVASRRWNLIDPFGLSKPNFTYHFKNQGFSNCKVYVAKIPKIN